MFVECFRKNGWKRRQNSTEDPPEAARPSKASPGRVNINPGNILGRVLVKKCGSSRKGVEK